MNNILLLLTGGTIGSITTGDTINVSDDNEYYLESCKLTENYYTGNGNGQVVFSIRRPLNILSENMNPEYWNTLCRALYREINDVTDTSYYDGVIIAHGSDTLSYTSAMLSIMFADTKIPIVLTAANHPLDNKITNGNRNFAACVDYISGRPGGGVWTIYEDNTGNMNVYNSSTICEADGYRDEYHDLTGCVCGMIREGRYIPCKEYVYEDHNNIANVVKENVHGILECKLKMTDNIMFLRPYPGFRYDRILLDSISADDNKPAAVLHWLYHSATATVESAHSENSFLGFAKKCQTVSVPVYIGTVNKNDESAYESHREMMECGVNCLYDISYELAYALLVIMYSVGCQTEKSPV